jgi:hypothetical protein
MTIQLTVSAPQGSASVRRDDGYKYYRPEVMDYLRSLISDHLKEEIEAGSLTVFEVINAFSSGIPQSWEKLWAEDVDEQTLLDIDYKTFGVDSENPGLIRSFIDSPRRFHGLPYADSYAVNIWEAVEEFRNLSLAFILSDSERTQARAFLLAYAGLTDLNMVHRIATGDTFASDLQTIIKS